MVTSTLFSNNRAKVGFAMQIHDLFYLIANGQTLPLIVKDFNNGAVDSQYLSPLEFLCQNGTVSSSGVAIQFQGHTTFVSNHQTALVVYRQQVESYNNSVTLFKDNSGLHGGAILLLGGAWIEAYPNSKVTFSGNTAISGAAIYVKMTTPIDFILSYSCFFRYSEQNTVIDKWNSSFLFFDNRTGFIHAKTIFVTTLNPCQNFYSGKLFVNKKPFCFCEDHGCNSCILNKTAGFVATSSAVFCNLSNETFQVIPGKVENLNICILDELGKSISDTQFTAICTNNSNKHCDKSPCVLPAYQVTQDQIKIAGNPETFCQLQLQTISDFSISRIFNVSLLNCPPGFYFSSAIGQCKCLTNHTNHNPAVISCDSFNFQAYISTFTGLDTSLVP